jgi:hypothetical protein
MDAWMRIPGSGPSAFPKSRVMAQGENPPTVPIDMTVIREFVYPDTAEVREYQRIISQNALLKNTLVVLPTGLGKTLIAAVVMYNYYRFSPSSCQIDSFIRTNFFQVVSDREDYFYGTYKASRDPAGSSLPQRDGHSTMQVCI